jgi:SAM-dependent methyltransferase
MKITHQEIRDYFDTFEWFREPAKQGYLEAAIDRLAHTLTLIPRLPNPEQVRVLEIGGIPYFMTALIKKHFGYQVECANEPTWKTDQEDNVEVIVNDHGERHEIHWKSLNIEYDTWPWEDNRFDLVIYCEVIEHMTYDPTHTLVEAHRVLKTDTGQLLLSTPNALAWQYLVDNLAGRNFYPPYSGYNQYARHHRLFTVDELAALCRGIGYEITSSYTTRDTAYLHPERFEPVAKLLTRFGKLTGRQDVIYLLATAKGTPKWAYPDALPYQIYADTHAYPNASKPVLRMADNESGQLRGGFHAVEEWGGGIRWTQEEARAVLTSSGESKVMVTFSTGERGTDTTVRGAVTVGDEAGTITERQEFEAPAQTEQTVTVTIPDGAPAEVLVTISVDNPMRPGHAGRGSKDPRTLGVAVREIALT